MMTPSIPPRSMAGSLIAPLACILMAGTAAAADVTYDRLVNPEPQNWLTVHHDYGAQRFSPLAIINKGNVKGLKLAFRSRGRRHLQQREPGGAAAGRGRLHVHG